MFLFSNRSLLPDDVEACSFFRSAMATFIAVISADRFCNNLSRSAMEDSPMAGGEGVGTGRGGWPVSDVASSGGAAVDGLVAVGSVVVAVGGVVAVDGGAAI
ncbi:hypothetical protein GUJ93_ZPchr0013g36814 [Zizania palustris]|uniref:Uncharacterized protein n=1 Tax=Zizania palustris TaxID=103762 RepID=A0A8J5X2N0_ZIZPA|nr:hypothetical protein GUJ93_ZPchr0013g36814 [Zizania palustris]